MPTIKSFPNFFSSTPLETLKNIQTVTEYLHQKYHARCYIVGGAVRDRLLGRRCKDYDIECYNITVENFEEAMVHLGAQGVGKSFFVYKYHELDIALPRYETKISYGHRGFEVTLASEESEASKRRDFTINALMYDIQNEQIIDHWSGLEDIARKRLRVVDEHSFSEDSLRVLRAMQFAARLGFKVEAKTCALCQSISLDDLPKERLFLEFEKMFKGAYLHYGLYYLFALGIAEKLFGEFIDKVTFIKLAKKLEQAKASFVEALLPYYFLFICKPYFHTDIMVLLERIAAPKQYVKKLLPPAPDHVDASFVAKMALKEGIVSYVGNYDSEVIRLAKALDVWDKPFNRGVIPTELMQEGFEGKALGEELERRTQIKINELKEKVL